MSSVETEQTEQAAVPASGSRTPKDMALSLGVLLVPLLLVVLGYRLFYGWDTAVTVDPANAIASAERASFAPLPLAAPEGWQTVTAKWEPGVLRIGYLDPDNHGARLVQSRAALDTLVKDELDGKAVADGETVVGAVTWQRFRGPDEQTALARTAGNTTTLLIGAENADLTGLASAIAR
ncbi:DUF4245 family protein [Catellatospora sp. NPDC049111]|uniref:DUF4245 family protein n=1 Tax=Catellatospora sp. NPDC049111 TaxID=3155271 RepID=UPI0033C2FD31